MAGKKLGRGLKFLLSENQNELELDHTQTRTSSNKEIVTLKEATKIPLNSLISNPFQPREEWNKEELLQLAKSIAENGVLQPILARRVGDNYQIIAGERRVRAARIAGKTKIQAILKNVTDEEMHVLALIENIQREDLGPIEKAKSFELLRKKAQLSHEELSNRLGMKRSTVTNYLRLLELPQEIKKQLEEKRISMGHARALLSVPEEGRALLAKEILNNRLSVREVERRAKQLREQKQPKQKGIKNKKGSPWIKEWEEILKQKLGSPVSIKYKAGKGKIEILTPTKSEMTRVFNLLLALNEDS